MKLAQILGYQIDITRHAALRSLHGSLVGTGLNPPSLTALIVVRDRPGCDQTTLGRALAGNRSLGMNIAATLEAKGLLTRDVGRDRRSKGLFLTAEGERVLAACARRHEQAEARLAACLAPGERELLLELLGKVRQGLAGDEGEIRGGVRTAHDEPAAALGIAN